MEIIFYHPTFDTQYWICELEKQLPGARVREWKAGDNRPADYALVWHPPVEMLQGRALKAVFALGAGVDSILSKLRDHPDMLPLSIPLFRLEDTGMGRQMQEYAVSQVLHWFRRFDDYQALWLPAGSRCPSTAPTNSPSGLWAPACWGRRLRKVCNPGVPASRLEP